MKTAGHKYFSKWSVFIVVLALFLMITCPPLANASGPHHSTSNAFSADVSFDIHEKCLDSSSDDFADVIDFMVDLGYSVFTGYFELYDEETSNLYIPFADDDANYFIPFFEDGSLIRFGGQDLILYGTCTPSANNYFAYNRYSAARILAQDNSGIVTSSAVLQASLGDPLNPYRIITSNGPSDPYTGYTNIAVTGDFQSWLDIKAAMSAAGLLPGETINLQGIPENSFIFSASDEQVPRDTLTLIRSQVDFRRHPDGLDAGVPGAFFAQPLLVFTKPEAEPRQPIPVNVQKTTPPGHQLLTKRLLQKPFNKMVNSIKKHFRSVGLEFVSNKPFVTKSDTVDGEPANIFDYGLKCIRNEENCQFDNRDTLYWWDRKAHTLEADDYYVLVGVNYTKLGAADYSKLGLYFVNDPDSGNPFDLIDGASNTELAMYPISDIVELKTLGQKFVAKKSFMLQVGRPQNCIDGITSLCPDTDTLSDAQSFVFLGQLTFNPETGTRPSKRQVIPWRLLKFKVPQP